MSSVIPVVPLEELAAHDTKHLLALRDRLLACEESLECSDLLLAEVDPSNIHFMDDVRWSELYQAVKAELATREHIPSGDERKAARKERAKAQRSRGRTRR